MESSIMQKRYAFELRFDPKIWLGFFYQTCLFLFMAMRALIFAIYLFWVDNYFTTMLFVAVI